MTTPLPQKREPSRRMCQRSFKARVSASTVAISRSGAPSARSSGVKIKSQRCPNASASDQPSRRDAPSFQAVMRRSRPVAMTM